MITFYLQPPESDDTSSALVCVRECVCVCEWRCLWIFAHVLESSPSPKVELIDF